MADGSSNSLESNHQLLEDATNFLCFVKELATKLPASTLRSFKDTPSHSLDNSIDDKSTVTDESDDSRDSGFENDTIQTNSETRKFQCTKCNKLFKRRSSLSTHKLIHLNIKPFTCPECPKEFLRRSDLKKHALMHSGKKPHECPQCKKVFSQSSNMLTHMRRHTGIRPFSCHICGHAFYRKVDVRRHQSRHQKDVTTHD